MHQHGGGVGGGAHEGQHGERVARRAVVGPHRVVVLHHVARVAAAAVAAVGAARAARAAAAARAARAAGFAALLRYTLVSSLYVLLIYYEKLFIFKEQLIT